MILRSCLLFGCDDKHHRLPGLLGITVGFFVLLGTQHYSLVELPPACFTFLASLVRTEARTDFGSGFIREAILYKDRRGQLMIHILLAHFETSQSAAPFVYLSHQLKRNCLANAKFIQYTLGDTSSLRLANYLQALTSSMRAFFSLKVTLYHA